VNFFIPLGDDPAKADYLWHGARELLHATGFPTLERRIHSLFYSRGGVPRVVQVGAGEGDYGEPVLLIFQAADAPFYWVCTILNGIIEGTPIPVPASEVVCAVPFDHH
jgi:hypothetical protein